MAAKKGPARRLRAWARVAPQLDGKEFSEYLERLLAEAGVETSVAAPGHVVFREGDPGDQVYFIDRGTVRIACRGAEGRERLLARLGPGELFGELAILDRPIRSATATAEGEVRLFVIPKAKARDLLCTVPQLSLWMLNVLAQRLRVMDRTIAQMEQVHEVNLRILEGQEAERRRVGRDLHDGPAQCFADYIMRLQIIDRLLDKKPEEAREEVRSLQGSLREGLDKIRELIYGLHPKELTQTGLVGAIEKFVARLGQSVGATVTFQYDPLPAALPPAQEATLYCIVQEALNNARKHAKATKVELALRVSGETLSLTVADDGAGFDVDRLAAEYGTSDHYGLSTMEDRIELAGGTMHIESAPGTGTTLTFALPLPLTTGVAKGV